MKIFVVDDDAMLRMVLADYLLEDDREFYEFDRGEALLANDDTSPDVILLDIEMPGINGIETCKKWRESFGDNSQIIFVSSHDDIRTRLEAYDAGGNDFILKPVNAEELRRKVKVAEIHYKQKNELNEQANMAGKTAFAALSTIGEMGVIHEFMRASFGANKMESLAEAIVNAVKSYDLQALVSVKNAQISTTGNPLTQLEVSLLGHASQMGRIFQFHDRLVLNFHLVTLLINKVDEVDEDRLGRLRDHLAIIAEGANTRAEAIEVELSKSGQSQEILKTLSFIVKSLEQLQENHVRTSLLVRNVNNNMIHKLSDAFVSIALTAEQEAQLFLIADQAQAELEAMREQDNVVNQKLVSDVADRLHQLLGQEQTMTFFE